MWKVEFLITLQCDLFSTKQTLQETAVAGLTGSILVIQHYRTAEPTGFSTAGNIANSRPVSSRNYEQG